MGLITGLLSLPLLPVRSVVWLADQVLAQAEGEQAEQEAVYWRLDEIQRALAAGEITAEEAVELEEEVIDGLQREHGEDVRHGG